jgi:predicted nucleotide-binding protein
MLILRQLAPAGKDLLNVIKELPENVYGGQANTIGSLLGYIKSTQSLISKLIKRQINFSNNSFVPNKFSNKVFIVHGHDDNMLQNVNLFLRKLELSPIILHEQPNKGRTIIEKFVDYSDVGFAVVLLSPDDKAIANEKQINRARQNVIFELGYFIGRLGRDRVAALYKSSVEIPSDYSGVLYLEFNSSENWKIQLCKELKAVGFNIDLNKAFD